MTLNTHTHAHTHQIPHQKNNPRGTSQGYIYVPQMSVVNNENDINF